MSSSHNPGGGSRDDYTFKIMMIGDSGVGKTGIMERFADDSFNEGHAPTIGVDFKVRTITFDDKPVKLQIWDASGQDKYKEAVSSYYKEADGVIIVYDVTNRWAKSIFPTFILFIFQICFFPENPLPTSRTGLTRSRRAATTRSPFSWSATRQMQKGEGISVLLFKLTIFFVSLLKTM